MTIKSPSMYRVMGLPPGIFGEAYVVISVWQPSTMLWRAEYNILAKRPHEYLTNILVDFNIENYPPELPPIDEAYMEAEAVAQAEIDLSLELERRAKIENRLELAYLPLRLERTKLTPVSLWVRDTFPTKFIGMANQTNSPNLKQYLGMVMGLGKLRAI